MTGAQLDAASPCSTRQAHVDEPRGRDWSRRRVLAAAAAGGAVAVAVPGRLLAVRLDDQPGTPPIARGRGSRTSFGSVAVLAARRAARHDSGAHTHGGEDAAGGPLPNLTWSTTVAVQVEMFNGTQRGVLLSPGQFRLRLGPRGTTVAPYDASAPAVLAPDTSLDTWITYLAPLEESDLRLEYDDTGVTAPLHFRLAGLPSAAATGP